MAPSSNNSLSVTYLEALVSYLRSSADADAWVGQQLHVIQTGIFLDDPVLNAAVATLHEHDPLDVNFMSQERVEDQQGYPRVGDSFASRHQVIGGPQTLDGADAWWYHYVLRLQNYGQRNARKQLPAWEHNDRLLIWLKRALRMAQPNVLGVTAVNEENAIRLVLRRVRVAESGGPVSSWIWDSLIYFSLLVWYDI